MKILSRKMQEVKEIRSTFSMGNKKGRESTRASKATWVSHYSQKISIGDN